MNSWQQPWSEKALGQIHDDNPSGVWDIGGSAATTAITALDLSAYTPRDVRLAECFILLTGATALTCFLASDTSSYSASQSYCIVGGIGSIGAQCLIPVNANGITYWRTWDAATSSGPGNGTVYLSYQRYIL